ncbi:MAG: response regulator [Deltaproteobacteria bacterium]|nr:response regulator [Deltaproteobacteria bacterium]MCX7952884.1 response regulator [Deltaproteobacteria bacterium]
MKKILVVDDDLDTREILGKILEGLGHKAFLAESGPKALEFITSSPEKLDLFILDIMMPEMNGYELMSKIREMPRYAETPIMMVTARDADTDVLEGYKQGADYYITKPFTSKHIEWGLKIFFDEQS